MPLIHLFCKNLENYGWFYDRESLVMGKPFHKKKQEIGNWRTEKQKITKIFFGVNQTNKLNMLGTSRTKIDDVADMFEYADFVFAHNSWGKLPDIHLGIYRP